MAGATARVPAVRRILMGGDNGVEFSGGSVSFADMDFGFFEEAEGSPESFGNNGDGYNEEEFVDGDEDDENSGNVEERKAYWEAQHQLLQETLSRSSPLESRIRHATKEALRKSQLLGTVCVCRRPNVGGCRNCLQRDITDRLRDAGYNSAICKSKWRSSPDIPSGEHTYLDVVDRSSSKKREVRVVIELSFRAEFEMARASEEYNQLISRLPEVFVGKDDRLRDLIKILCSAAKRCMKDKKMHMGPWRKHKYMQAKWLSTCERTTPAQLYPIPMGFSEQPSKPKASMLTFDLLEKLPRLHCTAFEVARLGNKVLHTIACVPLDL
ncbi:hypothetical protein HHK36_023646 [Tetracentron sinense]|uniref:Uncharacterized protein n=1 Tax=Tetracentron sinense TaxID=13715 RepID=A0A834YSR7_TETSI|nr:hypothetical protein HHK36_023646 [Tetracentron sinense]